MGDFSGVPLATLTSIGVAQVNAMHTLGSTPKMELIPPASSLPSGFSLSTLFVGALHPSSSASVGVATALQKSTALPIAIEQQLLIPAVSLSTMVLSVSMQDAFGGGKKH